MHDLSYYLISSPLAAIYTLLLGVSMLVVFDTAGLRLFNQYAPWIRAMYFFSGLLVTANIILLLGACSLVTTTLLQLMAACIITCAAIIVYRKKLISKLNSALPVLNGTGWPGYLVLICLVAQLFIALAPPTDADSLDYHLGIPVEMLNSHSAWLNKDNLHFRMFGFGEMLNLLGLANGCAQFGAFIQYISLLWLLVVCISIVDKERKPQVAAMVLSVPVFLFLIATQKHQLTGVACTSICFIGVYKYKDEIRGKILALFIAVLLFAAGIKYSFLLSMAVLIFSFMYSTKRPMAAIAWLTVLGLIFLGPMYLVKYINYNDPLSPLLEKYTSHPDIAVTRLSSSLKRFRESSLPFPLGLLIPKSAGYISTILGTGLLLIIAVAAFARKQTVAVFTICLFIVLTILFSQTTSRFFIEPYVWAVIVIFTAPAIPALIQPISVLCRLQFVLLVPLFVLMALLLGRGIISNKAREHVMSDYSTGYAESRWMDTVLPDDAIVCTDIRSRSLLPRPYFPVEYLKLIVQNPQRLDEMIYNKYKVNYLVAGDKMLPALHERYAGELIAEKTFYKATRNPFNKKAFTLKIYSTGK